MDTITPVKTKIKRLSKSERTHNRRVKQEARRTNTSKEELKKRKRLV